jgi:hypothetical protein
LLIFSFTDQLREAAEVYELACDKFLEVTGRRYVDELMLEDVKRASLWSKFLPTPKRSTNRSAASAASSSTLKTESSVI